MQEQAKQTVPLKEGFWTHPGDADPPQLIGSQCKSCGELYFPIKPKGWCVHCQKRELGDVPLSRRGKVASVTLVTQKPGGGFYKGDVPYAYGLVDLPEGVRLVSHFKAADLADIHVGDEVELVIERLYTDEEGREVQHFTFQPVS
jgi:uncharacterized OB-fold protein